MTTLLPSASAAAALATHLSRVRSVSWLAHT